MSTRERIHVYCINLDKEPRKFLKIKQEFDNYFEIERVSAIDASMESITGIEALFQTNIQLFKKIIETQVKEDKDKEDKDKEQKQEKDKEDKDKEDKEDKEDKDKEQKQERNNYVIILEDDVYKCPDFDEYFPKICEFINNNLKWDFISLDNFLNFEKPKMEIYNDFLYKIDKSRTTGFMIYNINFLKKNIDYLSDCKILDMSMKQNPDFIQLIPNKILVKQIVDKVSGTCLINTKHYENYYKETEKYMKKYFL